MVTSSMHAENFDSVSAPAWPSTWTKGGANGPADHDQLGEALRDELGKLREQRHCNRVRILRPDFNLFDVREPRLKFWYATNTDSNGDSLKVQYSTNGGTTWFDVMAETTANTVGQWTQFVSNKLPVEPNVTVRFTTTSNRTTDSSTSTTSTSTTSRAPRVTTSPTS